MRYSSKGALNIEPKFCRSNNLLEVFSKDYAFDLKDQQLIKSFSFMTGSEGKSI